MKVATEALDQPVTTKTLHKIFEIQADARPDAVAAVCGSVALTYARLESFANRMARYLRHQGVQPGSLVAMLLPRSVEAYAAILAILKAGAAYVPIDPGNPPDRIAYILQDCGATALVTTAALAEACPEFRAMVVRVDAERGQIAGESAARLGPEEIDVGPDDLCYIIYTSGSTGRPKGVMVEHRQVSHLVLAEAQIYGVEPHDRVYQGASLAFDLSVEEVWMAFRAGATLVAATPEMAQAGPDLALFLRQAKVTVLSCVPTLLSMLEEDVPDVRLLILGGEACPPNLVDRWARPSRRIVNTYGPTETTVIATYVELQPGKPVTIGQPISGCRVYLLDDDLRPVAPGEVGEICIGGAGVARGYVGLPQETRERFLADPFNAQSEAGARMYRSGDFGRLNASGEIEFAGRRDGQVKIRGFRVELSEIESVLLEAGDVRAAACAVREAAPGTAQLTAYVVPRDGAKLDVQQVRSHLRSRLPACMVPATIEMLNDLPRLASGKLDRASLPPPRTHKETEGNRQGRTDTEIHIARIWESLLGRGQISTDEDFFKDLGGHSLLAARMVSELRKDERLARVSMVDVYNHPTIASLAAALDGLASEKSSRKANPRGRDTRTERNEKRERRNYFATGCLQAATLWFPLAMRGVPWLTPYLVFFLMLARGYSMLQAAAWMSVAAMLAFPAMLLVAIAVKWLVLGRVRPGRHPLWGFYYLRWWFVRCVMDATNVGQLAGTPLLPVVYRLLGARIGKDVYIATERLAAFDLISIGDGASVDETAALLGYTVEDRHLVVGPVSIGRDCYIGNRAILREGSVMEDGARLEDLSLLPAGARVPSRETWAGSPAQRSASRDPELPPRPQFTRLRRVALGCSYAAVALAFPVLDLIAFVPFLSAFDWLSFSHPASLLILPLLGAAFVIILAAEAVAVKWLLVGRVRSGIFPLHGSFYVRNWMVETLLAHCLEAVAPIYATVYTAAWYRALGAKIGKFVELSTAYSSMPDLLEIADGSTIADEVSLGSPRIESGWMTVAPTRLGRRCFVGNSGIVPGGTSLGEDSLIGVLSIAPSDPAEAARPGASWLGSPPIALPQRQPSPEFSESRTYRPTRKLRLARGAFELLRVTFPPAGFIFVAAAVIDAALWLARDFRLGAVLLLLPFLYTGCCFVVAGLVAALKWLVMGRYQPFQRPLWSPFIWRLEFVNALYEFLATPLALDFLQGTPLLPWYLRLLGSRVGRQAYIETTGFLEWDVVEIGNRAVLNQYCVLQTHLFEDRVLKSSWLCIGDDCGVGADSVVLYDSQMQAGSRLEDLSLLMKGETLPPNTSWRGSPLAISEQLSQGDADRQKRALSAA